MNAKEVNGKDEDGCTPLHAACGYNNGQGLAQLLATPGIELNAKAKYGITPIMYSAAVGGKETLKLMLADLRVDIDIKGNSGKGLEEIVGNFGCKAIAKKECLEMIEQERRRRQNIGMEERQKCNKNNTVESVQNLEDVRDKVRIQYIELIDRANQQMQDREQRLDGKLEIRKLKMNDLKKKHDLEKRTLEEDFKREDEEEQGCLASLKEMTSQLARDLAKLEMANTRHQDTVKAARGTLECPICMEDMKPPVRIWMCPTSHIVCESCKDKLEGRLCPTCRSERVTLRAFLAENFARTVFHD